MAVETSDFVGRRLRLPGLDAGLAANRGLASREIAVINDTLYLGTDGTVDGNKPIGGSASPEAIAYRQATLEDVLEDAVWAVAYGVNAERSDNTAFLNNAIAAALTQNKVLRLPPGVLQVGSPLTLPNNAGALAVIGAGRRHSFIGGVNGDPIADTGTVLRYTGTAGTMFRWVLTGGSKRVYLTFDNITFEGNPAASSGHCIHLEAAGPTIAFIVNYSNVTVRKAKEHGIFHDGNVFECHLYDVRANYCGGSGFKEAFNSGGIPGETRIYGGYFAYNAIGLDLGGGGHNSLHGVSASYNTVNDLKNNGAEIEVFEFQAEMGGAPLGTDRILIQDCASPTFIGLLISPAAGATGNGIKFENVLSPYIHKLRSNSQVAAAGYKDIRFDNGTTRGTITGYWSNDFITRVDLGTGGGHYFARGDQKVTGTTHPRQSTVVTAYADIQIDARVADTFLVTFNGPGDSCGVGNPIRNQSYHDGQRINFIFKNATGAALTAINWFGDYLVNFTPPANGKVRAVSFEYVDSLGKWVQISQGVDL